MDPSRENNQDEFLLTFDDLKRVARKNKRKIKLGALICAFLALFYGLTKPPEYLVQATFKEKGKSPSGMSRSLSQVLMLSGESNDSDALTMMKSRTLMEQLVQEKGLQTVISKKVLQFPFPSLHTIADNILTEYALFRELKFPLLDDEKQDFVAERVVYTEETPLTITLLPTSEHEFKLIDQKDCIIGKGICDQPFVSEKFTLTVKRCSKKPVMGEEYSLTFFPLGMIAEGTGKRFFIEEDKDDKAVLKIIYKYPNRHQAADHAKTLMSLYQNHLYNEHHRLCGLQVSYLIDRQKKTSKQLKNIMDLHAEELSSDLSATGFATSQKAMDFLAASQQELSRKKFVVDLEIQRLENIGNQPSPDYDKFISMHQSEVFHRLADELRALKQQSDALNMALRNTPLNAKDFQEYFSSQLDELEKIKRYSKEAEIMLVSLQNGKIPEYCKNLIENPRFVVKAWYERLVDLNKAKDKNKEEILDCKDGFSSYLKHLVHFLHVHQRNLEAHLSHQQAPLDDFQGITLNTAKELYIAYSKDLSAVEAQAIQHGFIIEHLNHPDFELSSLSTILSDSVSVDMISKASAILLALKDYENRSSKEQERLKADLVIQKGFLTSHLQQAIQLLELKQKFLKSKINQLQNVTLSLIQEEITILENQIKKYISGTLESLQQEQNLLEQNLTDLRTEMAAFPRKWVAEQMIEQQMRINQSMVEEITRLVETKNISANLERIQSAPIDMPVVPLHPKSPRLLLLMILGAFGGAFFSFTGIFIRSAFRGVEASEENLILAKKHVSGTLIREYKAASNQEPMLDSDLDTFRRLLAFVTEGINHSSSSPLGKTLLLLKSRGPNFAIPLSELLSRKGYKVLLVDLCFDSYQNNIKAGMLQYLEGKASTPEIQNQSFFDYIASGGICRYGNEMVSSKRFEELLDRLRTQYDWIVFCSNASPESAEADSLLEMFPNAAITLTGELLHQLRHCFKYASRPNARVSFLFHS